MVYLAYAGMQDMFLTEDPDFTHFKSVYSRDEQCVTKVTEEPFDQTSYNVGDTLAATLKQNGDFLSKISLKVKLPSIVPASIYWVYPDVVNFTGNTVTVFNSSDSQVFQITVNGLLATTENLDWLTVTSNGYVSASTFVTVNTNNKFSFTAPSGSYAVFSDIAFANFFGFTSDSIQLFGGYVRFNNATVSQVTFQESGWISGNQVYNQTYSYLDDTMYKLINSVGLYIGKQIIQEFDSATIKLYKETTSTYKNRPVLKLLEGDDSIVENDRTYYFQIPFIVLPVYAIPRHDIQIRIKTNPIGAPLGDWSMSLILTYATFSVKLPTEYTIQVPQVSYFTNQKLDMKGPVKKIVVSSGNPKFSLTLNGEPFIDDVNTKTGAFENLPNVPISSNSFAVLNNPINMSRIRDQVFVSNTMNYTDITQYINGVYVESVNILRISNEISGLMYGVTDTSNYPVVTSALTNPQTTSNVYLFDQIPQTVSGMLSFYSMRTVSFEYRGPVIRLRNESTDFEDDFYSDTTQSFLRTSNGTSVSNFLPARVVTWYDQSLNRNNLIQPIKVAQPSVVLNNGKYVVAILNDTSNPDFVRPSYWLDISKPIHPQQFAMTMKLNALGDYNDPITIFSNQNSDFRISGGSLYGNGNAGDWAYLPNGGSTYFTVNGTGAYSISSTGTWYNVTSWKTGVYSGPDMNTVGIPGPGFFQTPKRSMNGYFYELGFMKQMTLSSESAEYYGNRPPL